MKNTSDLKDKEKSNKLKKNIDLKKHKNNIIIGISLLIFFAILVFLNYLYKGQIDAIQAGSVSYPLLILSIIIGFLDGFNPCAMWVLIYLITMVSTLKDKKKLFLIVGTFVITEAVMYFFILAGWLEVTNYLVQFNWILIGAGILAIYFGIKQILDFIKNGGKVSCEVGDLKTRKKTTLQIKNIVNSPITIGSIFATILLAIAVNSFEFLCSWQFVSVFTTALNSAGISTFMKYFYIIVYDFFFMLDDFIIFGLAILAIRSDLFEKYSAISKLLGGIIMFVLGIVIIFFRELLL